MADNLGPIVGARETGVVEWKPKMELMTPLLEMGLSENSAKRGIYFTGGISVDAAASWIFENLDDPDINSPFNVQLEAEQPSNAVEVSPIKMVFVVNSELKMGVGKIAAQVAHAGLAIQRKLLQGSDKMRIMANEWEEMGATKIVLSGNSASQLMEMENEAKRLDLSFYLVVDAGRTQVRPSSVTVLGIFGNAEEVNRITGHLSLL